MTPVSKFEYQSKLWKLKRPLKTSHGEIAKRSSIMLRVSEPGRTDVVGLGEASPLPGWSKESYDEVLKQVSSLPEVLPRFSSDSPGALDAWLDKLLDANEQYIATYDGEGPKLVPLESERGRNGNYDRVIEGCLLDKKESEPPRKRRRSPESELFSSDSSDDESPLPSPSPPLEPYPVSSQSSIFDPPTDPRIVDLTHE